MALEKLLPFYGCTAHRRSAARRSMLEFAAKHDPAVCLSFASDLDVDRGNGQARQTNNIVRRAPLG
jgi:hypothetical protein